MNLSTYILAGYPGLAVITSEEARAETEIAAVCATLNRQLHAWSSTEGLIDLTESRVSQCPDPLDALQLIDGIFAQREPQTVVLLRDIQLHLEHTDPMLTRRIKDIVGQSEANLRAVIQTAEARPPLPPTTSHGRRLSESLNQRRNPINDKGIHASIALPARRPPDHFPFEAAQSRGLLPARCAQAGSY